MRILCLGGSYTGMYLSRNFPEAEVTFLARDPERLIFERLRIVDSDLIDARAPFDLVLDTVPTVKLDGEIHLPYRAWRNLRRTLRDAGRS